MISKTYNLNYAEALEAAAERLAAGGDDGMLGWDGARCKSEIEALRADLRAHKADMATFAVAMSDEIQRLKKEIELCRTLRRLRKP